jgi:alpha-mannosidase
VHPGEFVVRYAFTSHAGDWRSGQAHQFGWGVANPPLPVWMHGPQSGTLPTSSSFCQIDAPNVSLLTFKPAEDGDGYILRTIEQEGQETAVTISLPWVTIVQAVETNLVEEDGQPLSYTAHTVQITLPPFAIRTIRVNVEPIQGRGQR